MPMISPPIAGSYDPYFDTYISKVNGKDPIKLLAALVLDFKALLSEVPDELENFRYAEGKWSVKEVVGHMVDTERIMCYRALCVARGEQNSLPGFDENSYVTTANFSSRELYDLSHEFGAVREATLSFFKKISEEDLDRKGIANNKPVSARTILYIIVGHQLHHMAVLKEKYLQDIL